MKEMLPDRFWALNYDYILRIGLQLVAISKIYKIATSKMLRTRKMAPETAGAQSRRECRPEQPTSRTSSCAQQAESSACPLADSGCKN